MNQKKEISLTLISFVLICVFNTPLLSIYNKAGFSFSLPNLYVGIFGIWLTAIFCTYLIVREINNDND